MTGTQDFCSGQKTFWGAGDTYATKSLEVVNSNGSVALSVSNNQTVNIGGGQFLQGYHSIQGGFVFKAKTDGADGIGIYSSTGVGCGIFYAYPNSYCAFQSYLGHRLDFICTDNTKSVNIFAGNNGNNLALKIDAASGGSVGVKLNGLIPTANIDILGGTGAANTAPLKIRPGILLSTLENGAIEYTANEGYFCTAGNSRGKIARYGDVALGVAKNYKSRNILPQLLDKAVRTAPAGLPTLPMAYGYSDELKGVVTTPNDAINAAIAANAATYNATTYYVKPSTGSDANPGTSPSAPLATLSQALRTLATGSIIKIMEDCTFALFDLHATDASQATERLKVIDANGYNVKITSNQLDMSAQAWTQDIVNTNCGKATLSSLTGESVIAAFRLDMLDEEGEPVQLMPYASVSALNSAVSGFFWDPGTKTVYINICGKNIATIRDQIKIILSNAVNDPRILVYGAKIAFSGVRFEGIYFQLLEHASFTTRRPELWLHNCKVMYSPIKGIDMTTGGWVVASDCLFYRNRNDAINGFAPGGTTGKGLIQTVRCAFVGTGDTLLYPLDGTLQGISAHGGCDNVSFASFFQRNNAPGVADGCINGYADITWLVGCSFLPQAETMPNISAGTAATSGSRKVYIDTCYSRPSGADVSIGVNATFYQYGSTIPVISGGSISTYNPLSPP